MVNEVQIKRESKTGLYIATYKSKRLDSYGRLYRAKENVTRILKEH